MRHKWKKLKGKHHVDYDEVTHWVSHAKECINCGLRKGNVQIKYFGNLVYYKDDKVLSLDTLPFQCIGDSNDLFLKKEDFEDWKI